MAISLALSMTIGCSLLATGVLITSTLSIRRQLRQAAFDTLSHRQQTAEQQLQHLKLLQDSVREQMTDVRQQIQLSLQQQSNHLHHAVNQLTQETQQRLKDISQQVDLKLNEGFQKTNETFAGVLQRLTIIDEAQKKIAELSSNVVGLQEILVDKRSRGAFGEVQLSGLVRNMLPETHFSLQHHLSNGTRVDCLLFLPEPTGHIAIDSKFPLENYRKWVDENLDTNERQRHLTLFKQDVRKHIKDIATKYIIPGETADGAVLFIPAEAIFAEIHARLPDIVEESQKARVWLVSPTTLMAVLTTARAVLKDAATRQQIHLIQKHLSLLNQDFGRFKERMEKLASHIAQAHRDVEQVHVSSKKITEHFQRIEQVELGDTSTPIIVE
jgi:DNA recombination protein RmuC